MFLGFAGNDAPSFVFPTAIATKGGVGGSGGSGGSGSGRPAVANKPSYLTGGTGAGGSLSGKRGTEDLDFFIGDEALVAASGPGKCTKVQRASSKRSIYQVYHRLWNTLPSTARTSRELGWSSKQAIPETMALTVAGSHGTLLVELNFQVSSC